MSLTGRVVLSVAIVIVLMSVGVAFTVWALVLKPESVVVRIVEKGYRGDRISVALPSRVIEAVVKAAVLGNVCARPQEFDEWRPAIESIAASLNDVQNATLVAVTTDDERVRIVKRDGALRIEVETRDASVKVHVPRHTTKAILEAIGDI